MNRKEALDAAADDSFHDLLCLCDRVVDAVTMDDCGAMVAGQWVGGNGGLLSRETLSEVDQLRRRVARIRAGQE